MACFCRLASSHRSNSRLFFKIYVRTTKGRAWVWGRGSTVWVLLRETEAERNSKCQPDIAIEACLNGPKGRRKKKKERNVFCIKYLLHEA